MARHAPRERRRLPNVGEHKGPGAQASANPPAEWRESPSGEVDEHVVAGMTLRERIA